MNASIIIYLPVDTRFANEVQFTVIHVVHLVGV